MSWYDSLFYKTYYINLDKRPDRNEKILETLNFLGISNYERFSGVDETNWRERIPPPVASGLNIPRKTFRWPGAFFCACSHHLLLKHIKEKETKPVLILEDDARPSPNFFENLDIKIKRLSLLYWRLLYFYGPSPMHEMKFFKGEPVSGIVRLSNFYLLPTQAYVINGKDTLDTAIHISNPYLEVSNKKLGAIDKRFPKIAPNNTYAFYPDLIDQNKSFRSDIIHTQWSDII